MLHCEQVVQRGMAFRRQSSLFVLLLVMTDLFGGLAVARPPAAPLPPLSEGGYDFRDLESLWEEFSAKPVNCDRFPNHSKCGAREPVKRRSPNECTYTVTLRSKIFSNEELTMCAHPRHSLPCRMNGNVACEVPPMEVSQFDLMILYIINHELQARIMRLRSQSLMGRDLNLDLQREIELMISDNVAWMCSRKCDNSSCEFNAELQPHLRTVGGIPRMTSLITDYPYFVRGSRLQHIQIDLPIGSFEISRLLKKKAPFRHLAVPNLPLTVTCLKN